MRENETNCAGSSKGAKPEVKQSRQGVTILHTVDVVRQ